jgi:hypothetical protein
LKGKLIGLSAGGGGFYSRATLCWPQHPVVGERFD